MPYTCFICSLPLKNNRELVQHIPTMHPNCEYFECHPNDVCSSKYRYNSIESFQRHRTSKHHQEKNNFMDVDPYLEAEDDVGNVKKNSRYDMFSSLTKKRESCHNSKSLKEIFLELINFHLLMTFSELYGYTDLPRKRIVDIISLFSKKILQGKLFHFLQQFISDNVPLAISPNEHSTSEIIQLMESFSKSCEMYPTEYKQMQFLKDFGKFTEPQSFKIGERKDFKESEGVQVEVSLDLEASFIPLREILKSFFQMDNVLLQTLFYMDQLYQGIDNNPDVISNFIQGSYWKELIDDCSEDERQFVIPLIVYFDKFQVNNPLGTHAPKNKLGGIYCSLPVLPIKFQAKVENIFVIILFNALDRKMTEECFILIKLVEEITFLETTGITFEEFNITVYFRLALIVGDNLGVHSLLGLVESFSANFSCCFCLIYKGDLNNILDENDCVLRTIENYNEALRLNDCSKTGIKQDSIFNSLKRFHIIPALCVDIMHDLLEGICKYDLGFILHHYVFVAKYFSVDYLNSSLNSHGFDCNDKQSKPPSFDENHLAKQKIFLSASEVQCFMQNVTLIIGHRVPENDEFWQAILMLRQIMKIVFSTHFQKEICVYLKSLITEYLETITRLGIQLKPKYHFLLHYPSTMLKMGPLGRVSSMRFESKHRVLKNIASATTFCLNICKTIALKNQLIFSQRLVEDNGSYPSYTLGPLGLTYIHDYDGQEERVTSTKHLIFLGHKIKIHKSIIIRAEDIDLELFLVNEILITEFDRSVKFICNSIDYSYDKHFDAFEILNFGAVKVLNINDLYECTFTYKIFKQGRSFAPKKCI